MKWLIVATAVVVVGTGSARAQPPPPDYAPIPPPRHEYVPPPTGPRVVWEPGHWYWNGVRYIWIAGRYVERRPHYGHYLPGHWVWGPREGRWIWVRAHWE